MNQTQPGVLLQTALTGAERIALDTGGAVDVETTTGTLLGGTFPGGTTDASIRAAALAAFNAGGGIVKIPAGTITLYSPLPCYNGVGYEGVNEQTTWSTTTYRAPSGTILVGNGTFSGVSYNEADLGSQPLSAINYVNNMLRGFSLRNLIFSNFLHGVAIGGKNHAGMTSSWLENVTCENCTGWGFRLYNYQEVYGKFLYALNNTVGGILRICSNSATINHGNATWQGDFVQPATGGLSRGICFWADTGSSMNFELVLQPQCNQLGVSQVQAATMSNLSTNIAVTDGTKYPVGMPVQIASTVNGFYQGVTYFVLTNDGANNLTLALTPFSDDTALAATGNTAVNIESYGFPCFELAAQISTANLTSTHLQCCDAEGACTARFLVCGVKYSNIQGGFINGTDYTKFCLRSATQCQVTCRNSCTWDGDSASTSTNVDSSTVNQFTRNNSHTPMVGLGFMNNLTASVRALQNAGMIGMTGGAVTLPNGAQPDIYVNVTTYGIDFTQGIAIDEHQVTLAVQRNLSGTEGSNLSITTASPGGPIMLPTIVANMVGALFMITNPQVNAATVGITTAAQVFGGLAGATTFVLAPNSCAMFKASNDLQAGLHWQVVSYTQEGQLTCTQVLAITPTIPGTRLYVKGTDCDTASASLTYRKALATGSSTAEGWVSYINGAWVWD